MGELTQMKCTACRGGEPTLTDEEIAELRTQVPDWRIVERDGVKRLERAFTFDDFARALDARSEERGITRPFRLSGVRSPSRGGRTRSAGCTGTISLWRRERTTPSEAERSHALFFCGRIE